LVVENVVNKLDEISLADARRRFPEHPTRGKHRNGGHAAEFRPHRRPDGQAGDAAARIRQVEKNMVFEEFKGRGGDILSGTVRRFERSDVIIDLGKIEGIMPSRERVPTEEYQPGDRIRAFTLSVDNAIARARDHSLPQPSRLCPQAV
jgi:hypothetical protein